MFYQSRELDAEKMLKTESGSCLFILNLSGGLANLIPH